MTKDILDELDPSHELYGVVKEALDSLHLLPSTPAPVTPSKKAADPRTVHEGLEELRADHDIPLILDWSTMMTDLVQKGLPDEVIIDVLHKGCRGCISGASKAGKTWSLVNLAVAACSGQEWLGLKTKPSKVLYLDFELLEGFAKQRFKFVADKLKVPDEALKSNLKYWNLRDNNTPFEKLLLYIIFDGYREEFDLIILDPYYKLIPAGGYDENSAGDVMKVVSLIAKFSAATGAAFMFSHHFSKGNKAGVDSIDRASGSGVFARDPDAVLSLTKHMEDDCMTLEATLRNGPPIPDRVVEFSKDSFPAFVHREELKPGDLYTPPTTKRPAGRPVKPLADELVAAVLERHVKLGKKEWERLSKEEEGISRDRFDEAVSALKVAGRIETEDMGPGKPTFHSLRKGTV